MTLFNSETVGMQTTLPVTHVVQIFLCGIRHNSSSDLTQGLLGADDHSGLTSSGLNVLHQSQRSPSS